MKKVMIVSALTLALMSTAAAAQSYNPTCGYGSFVTAATNALKTDTFTVQLEFKTGDYQMYQGETGEEVAVVISGKARDSANVRHLNRVTAADGSEAIVDSTFHVVNNKLMGETHCVAYIKTAM